MAKKPKPQSLQARRLILLIKQLLPVYDGNQRDVATALHVDASLPSKFNDNPLRDVQPAVIDRLLASFEPQPGYRLDPAWFFDATLVNPHYRRFLRPKTTSGTLVPPPAQTRSEDAAAQDISPEAEAMLQALNASPHERELFDEHRKLFHYPFVNDAHVAAFIGGLRKGLSLIKATDAAVNAAIAHENARAKKDDEP